MGMASTSSLASFSSTSPLMGSKISINQPRFPPSRVSFQPFRVSAACASTNERPTSRIATPAPASSLYRVLGIQMDATFQEIKSAYRRPARTLHPDVADRKEDTTYEFIKLQEAYETLSDPERRVQYDRSFLRKINSPFVMSATVTTTMGRSPVASGFYGHTGRRWETDQCW